MIFIFIWAGKKKHFFSIVIQERRKKKQTEEKTIWREIILERKRRSRFIGFEKRERDWWLHFAFSFGFYKKKKS